MSIFLSSTKSRLTTDNICLKSYSFDNLRLYLMIRALRIAMDDIKARLMCIQINLISILNMRFFCILLVLKLLSINESLGQCNTCGTVSNVACISTTQYFRCNGTTGVGE